jgi:heptosyltransferase-2
MRAEVDGILILRFSSLGDVVMATAAARYLRARRPGSKIWMATKAAFAPLLEGQPDLDGVLPLGSDGLRGLAVRARESGVTALLDLHANLRSRLLGLRLGGPRVRWRSWSLQRRLRVAVPFLRLPEPAPVIRRYVEAAAALLNETPPAETPLPRLAVEAGARAWAERWLAEQGFKPGQRLLAVAPGAAWPTKRWSVAALARCLALVAEFDKVRFVLLGADTEAPLAQAVKAAMKKGAEKVFVACGQTRDVRRLVALIALSRAFLGHDSGPMHVAEALGVPATVLFGPTVRAFGFYPQGPGHRVFERELDCRPCSVHGSLRCPLGHHACLEQIEPFEVARHLCVQLGLEAVA